jgi:methionyl-tRNA formyltransferase
MKHLAMLESLDLVKAGVKLKHKQNLADGSYESWFKKDLTELDWSKPAADVYNTIRAANPAPGAWSMIKGIKLDIYDAVRVGLTGTPGSILALTSEGFTVAANGGAIHIKRVKAPDGKKIGASEYAAAAGLKVGDTFDAPAPKAAS